MGKGYDTFVLLLSIVLAAFAIEMLRPGLIAATIRQFGRLLGLP